MKAVVLCLLLCMVGSVGRAEQMSDNPNIIGHSVSIPQWQYLGTFKATAYCSCPKCCGKSDGITASGRKASIGTVACNWLPFGTKLQMREIAPNSKIRPLWMWSPMTVLDRGAKSLFGNKHNHIKHIDLWMPSHKQALNYGVHEVEVWAEVA